MREAKARAARRGCTLATLVSEALVHSFETRADVPETDDFEASQRWFQRNRERLRRRHPGEYVAVVKNAILDHDRDFDTLASRVFATIGVRPVFMPHLGVASAVVRARSPRIRP